MPEQTKNLLQTPRKRHYILGHEAFRQLCEYDPHQFFEKIASSEQQPFLSELVNQVVKACPDDVTKLNIDELSVTTSTIESYPFILISMPPIKAYAECIFVGIVALLDLSNPAMATQPEIGYFTLELGEGDNGECSMFCQWIGDTHYNLAEIEGQVSTEEFSMLVAKRISETN
ncbi:MAG: hypothetical protein KUG78_13565 [Kangiellaceae bacterium]|nr:hypothetical protein [Kangiellaceae bacterium]